MKSLIFLILLLFFFLICANSWAGELSPKTAVRAIIGEASGEGYQGMLAVACGIRNRGTLKGVYGLKAKHVDSEPQWVWDIAKKAWEESEDNRIHSGDHWGSTKFDKGWIKTMETKGFVKVYEYKGHIFYKR